MILCPVACGRNQGFGLARNSATLPVGDGDITSMSQASQTCYATGQAIKQVPGGHQVLERVNGADGHFALHRRERIHFRPEVDWVPQFTLCNLTQPVVVLAEDERHSSCMQAFAIAFKYGIADVLLLQW